MKYYNCITMMICSTILCSIFYKHDNCGYFFIYLYSNMKINLCCVNMFSSADAYIVVAVISSPGLLKTHVCWRPRSLFTQYRSVGLSYCPLCFLADTERVNVIILNDVMAELCGSCVYLSSWFKSILILRDVRFLIILLKC